MTFAVLIFRIVFFLALKQLKPFMKPHSFQRPGLLNYLHHLFAHQLGLYDTYYNIERDYNPSCILKRFYVGTFFLTYLLNFTGFYHICMQIIDN